MNKRFGAKLRRLAPMTPFRRPGGRGIDEEALPKVFAMIAFRKCYSFMIRRASSRHFPRPFAILWLAGLVCASGLGADEAAPSSLWSHDNLVAWCVVPFDAKHRGPEERAEMLERLGFKHFAYDWRDKDIPTFDAELDALAKHHIDLLGWWFPMTAPEPKTKLTLETFKRHNVHPQLWFTQGGALTKTPEEQKQRVNRVADQIAALEKTAAPYGCKVELYSHNGWFGMEENEVAIIQRLKELGITDVGMVYNFSHAHDGQHDDSAHFDEIWKMIQPYVVAVNLTGMGPVRMNCT